MTRINFRHLTRPAALAVGHASLLLSLLLTSASAQIVGPQPARPKASDKSAPAEAAKAPGEFSQKFEKEGLAVDFSIKSVSSGGVDAGLVEGADAMATFSVRDARTGQPLTGLRPSAWIGLRASEREPNEEECRDKIRSFMGGLLSVRPEHDLNSYLVLTINHDNTVSVINPQVSFSRTKLESLITLPGKGMDWVLSGNKERLYITLPEKSAVAVINTVTKKLIATIPTGENTRPTRIVLSPDGRNAWVGLDNSSQVAVIDTAEGRLARSVEVGAGLHNITFTPDGRFAYVTNSVAGTVSAVDARTMAKVADIKVGETPVPVAASSASGFVYVAAINGDSVSVIDPAKQQVIASIPTRRGVVALRFEPKSRFGFIVNHKESTVSVIDASTNSIVATTEVVKEPDQVVFTNKYAYVRGLGSEKFTLIELVDFTKVKPRPVDIQAGQTPPARAPEDIGVADIIAPTPEGSSAMIANAPEGMIYYYAEGMMAPMGTIQNYKRRPRAMLILDRSLAEVAPGVYSTPIKLRSAGKFDVPLLIGQPRIFKCFQMEVAKSPDGDKTRPGVSLAVRPAFKGQQFKPGEKVTLKFQLIDPLTNEPVTGLKDVQVLIFEPPGVWQRRQLAAEVGEGVYEVTQTFPRAALYNVMVSVASRGVSFADLPFTALPVVKPQPPAEARSARAETKE